MAKTSNSSNTNFSFRRFILQSIRIREARHSNSDIEIADTSKKVKCNYDTQQQEKSIDIDFIDENRITERDNRALYCVICYLKETENNKFYTLDICTHQFCINCLVRYLQNEINESRTDIDCPQCSLAIHPNNIDYLLKELPDLLRRYEDFMIRRYLVMDPDSRFCPAPDCSYAVIASGCASCPQIKCEGQNCGISFCYHCKDAWHPDQTCDAARIIRQKIKNPSLNYSHDSIRRDEIKPCPKCQILIVKMNDGSCNHMVCSVCGAEFCWLCMKEVSDLHYLSPSGCTFWGKKPWSRKKKIVWQIGTLIGAPVGIALLAGIAVPSMIIGIPVWIGRKLLDRYKTKPRRKKNLSVAIGVIASILISPFLAGLAIAIGVPILLFYVYGIVPISLCRSGCGSAGEEYSIDINDKEENRNKITADEDSISKFGETSMGDISISIASLDENVPNNNGEKNAK